MSKDQILDDLISELNEFLKNDKRCSHSMSLEKPNLWSIHLKVKCPHNNKEKVLESFCDNLIDKLEDLKKSTELGWYPEIFSVNASHDNTSDIRIVIVKIVFKSHVITCDRHLYLDMKKL